MKLNRHDIAEIIWRAEYKRATGKERNVSWQGGVSKWDKEKYLVVADAILEAELVS